MIHKLSYCTLQSTHISSSVLIFQIATVYEYDVHISVCVLENKTIIASSLFTLLTRDFSCVFFCCCIWCYWLNTFSIVSFFLFFSLLNLLFIECQRFAYLSVVNLFATCNRRWFSYKYWIHFYTIFQWKTITTLHLTIGSNDCDNWLIEFQHEKI